MLQDCIASGTRHPTSQEQALCASRMNFGVSKHKQLTKWLQTCPGWFQNQSVEVIMRGEVGGWSGGGAKAQAVPPFCKKILAATLYIQLNGTKQYLSKNFLPGFCPF